MTPILACIEPTRAMRRRAAASPVLLLLLGISAGCAGVGSDGTDWEALTQPRPAPLEGAPRVMVQGIEVQQAPERTGATVPMEDVLEELIGAGLLRRRDVHFQERRRFLEAVRMEDAGIPRPAGAPPIGTTLDAHVLLSGTWSMDRSLFALRLVDVGTGEVIRAGNLPVPSDADPISVARLAVGWMAEGLEEGGRLPEWEDPIVGSALPSYAPASIPERSLEHFLRGIEAEDRYDWEAAREAYLAAREAGAGRFFEADVALARVGRMRAGGTLGEG